MKSEYVPPKCEQCGAYVIAVRPCSNCGKRICDYCREYVHKCKEK